MHIKKTFRLPLNLFGKYQTSNDKMGKEGEGRMGWNAPPPLFRSILHRCYWYIWCSRMHSSVVHKPQSYSTIFRCIKSSVPFIHFKQLHHLSCFWQLSFYHYISQVTRFMHSSQSIFVLSLWSCSTTSMVTTKIGNHLCIGKPSRFVTSYSSQLSLAIPPCWGLILSVNVSRLT